MGEGVGWEERVGDRLTMVGLPEGEVVKAGVIEGDTEGEGAMEVVRLRGALPLYVPLPVRDRVEVGQAERVGDMEGEMVGVEEGLTVVVWVTERVGVRVEVVDSVDFRVAERVRVPEVQGEGERELLMVEDRVEEVVGERVGELEGVDVGVVLGLERVAEEEGVTEGEEEREGVRDAQPLVVTEKEPVGVEVEDREGE